MALIAPGDRPESCVGVELVVGVATTVVSIALGVVVVVSTPSAVVEGEMGEVVEGCCSLAVADAIRIVCVPLPVARMGSVDSAVLPLPPMVVLLTVVVDELLLEDSAVEVGVSIAVVVVKVLIVVVTVSVVLWLVIVLLGVS